MHVTKSTVLQTKRFTVPSQVGQSLDGNGTLRFMEDGR